MNVLISVQEVLRRAFADGDIVTDGLLNEDDIAAAEQRWVKPALGQSLYERLLGGEYREFLYDYVAPAEALYVRYLVQQRLDVKTTLRGTETLMSGYGRISSDKVLLRMRRSLLVEADTLLRRAVEYLAAEAAQFPEYRPHESVVPNGHLAGGLIL